MFRQNSSNTDDLYGDGNDNDSNKAVQDQAQDPVTGYYNNSNQDENLNLQGLVKFDSLESPTNNLNFEISTYPPTSNNNNYTPNANYNKDYPAINANYTNDYSGVGSGGAGTSEAQPVYGPVLGNRVPGTSATDQPYTLPNNQIQQSNNITTHIEDVDNDQE